MACVTFIAPLMAMATTQLARQTQCLEASVWQTEGNQGHNSLRMSWVVVIGENGGRSLRIQWASAESI